MQSILLLGNSIRLNYMSEPHFELPKNLTPRDPADNDREIEEIVSPIQPEPKHKHLKSGLIPLLLVLLCAGVGAIVLYDAWPKFEYGAKEAKAPEVVAQAVVPTPSVIESVQVPTPTPLISSIATDVPSAVAVVPTPTPVVKVAGVSTTRTKKATTYTAVDGVRIALAAGETASTGEGVTVVYAASGAVLLRVEQSAFLLDTPAALGYQLALSPDISRLQSTFIGDYPAFSYVQAGHKGMAVIRGQSVYYVTEQAQNQLSKFSVQ